MHNYVLDGMRNLADYSNGAELKFAYDENNHPQSFTYNGTKYNYITNLQGDVIEIRDNNNALVGSYIYNAYGKIISKSGSMADINPLRYRGYYQDSETGFYYLNSRYYDSEIGRFINADGLIDTGEFLGYNLFAYCINNPVNASDPTGHLFIEQAGGGGAAYAGYPGAFSNTYGQGLTGSGGGGLRIPPAIGTVAILALGTEALLAEKHNSRSRANEKPKNITIAPATPNKKDPVIFPANPSDFHPAGLTALTLPGTYNGAIIKWMSGKETVFEWDENPNGPAGDGPHYHIRDLGDIHFYPGMAVPEPYATIYFGGQ